MRYKAIWAVMAIFAVMACTQASKSSGKVEVTQVVTARVDTSINSTWDYKKPESIGAFAKGYAEVVEGVHGDYVQVSNTNAIVGYVWTELFDKPMIYNESGMIVGDMITCTNRVGASIKAEPNKRGKTIGAVKVNETVTVLSVVPTWYRVTVGTEQGARSGWVYAGNVEVTQVTNYHTKQ